MRLIAMIATVILAARCAGTMDREREQKIDRLLAAYAGNVPGASVGVIESGTLVFTKSYGFADLDGAVRATARSNYRLASVSKQFTAMAIMILAERGTLSYDDSIARYFPQLTPAITIRHLLTHTSGLLAYEDLIPEGTTTPLLDRDVLEILSRQTTTYFDPGTKYRYSNSGYALLALIVERASGMRFADFLRENIFEPAGMTTSVAFEKGISEIEDRAFGHRRDGDRFVRDDQSLTSSVLGDGGIYASVEDLARWIDALESNRIVGETRLREAISPLVVTDKEGMSYGFGWRVSAERRHHTGETRGFRNALVWVPSRGLAVVVLTNRNEGTPIDIANAIVEMW